MRLKRTSEARPTARKSDSQLESAAGSVPTPIVARSEAMENARVAVGRLRTVFLRNCASLPPKRGVIIRFGERGVLPMQRTSLQVDGFSLALQ
jgi:hypothetical protein